MQKHFPIPDDADVEYVYNGLMKLGASIAKETIDKIIEGDGKIKSMPQQEEETVLKPAPKIFKETCQINWNQPAKKVYDFVRGLSPYPGTWTILLENGKEDKPIKLKIFKTHKTENIANEPVGTILLEKNHLYIATTDNWLEIMELQAPGKKRMQAHDFANGAEWLTRSKIGIQYTE